MEAVEKKKEQYWFKPKWRQERTASVKCEHNLFYDFGEGIGGNTVDFVMKHFAIDFTQAVKWLQEEDVIFSFDPPVPEIPKNINYTITKTQKIRNKNLIAYLSSRKINSEFAKLFCVEIYYSFDNKKEYYGIGFKNDSNGYEIRSKYFKGCLGKKELTTINNNSDVVSIFESWSDFLSYLTLKNKIPNENFIILNSTSLAKKTISLLDQYANINLFLDQDEAGNIASNILIKNFQNKIIDNRTHYKNHNDLNDYLMNTK